MKKSLSKIISIFIICLYLQGCVAAAVGGLAGTFAYFFGNKAGQRSEARIKNEALVEVRREMEEKQKATNEADKNVANEINQRLIAGAVDQQLAVYPEVKNGVVILHGRVPDAKTADKIIQSTRQSPGVSRIISNLVIVDQAQINRQIASQQKLGGQIAMPPQYQQQIIQPQQPVMPAQQIQYYQPQPQPQQYQIPMQPQQQIAPQFQPQMIQPQQFQQPQQQFPQQFQQQPQQMQYPPYQGQPQGYYQNFPTEKKSLNSAENFSEEKKNLRRPANYYPNNQNPYINAVNYQNQQAPPNYQNQNYQQPSIMPQNQVEFYQDNDSTYTKYPPSVLNKVNQIYERKSLKNLQVPSSSGLQDNDEQYIMPKNFVDRNSKKNQKSIDDIPIPTPSITEDYDSSYRPLGSYAPEGKIQYTAPASEMYIPVPTPSVVSDYDEYYRPLNSYNPNGFPTQQYISPAEEEGALEDIPTPTPSVEAGDNDQNYYYFY
ncbi:MAG: BON domain-containing protein [Rickettsiales bacterium]|nr:BON domain-containing protein [Rickettsiales bacterium]